MGSCMIVCFDLSSEKLDVIELPYEMLHEGLRRGTTLINYKGNLGILVIHGHEVVLWVLEDAGKHKWSKRISATLSSLYDEIGNNPYIVGMTSAGEFVLSSCYQSIPFRIVYYNIERMTLTRVNIQGLEEIKDDPNPTPRIFLDYVENMKLL
ncbi:unnamed protein product [Microthlaspi erraticum]|uniref:F-box associated beta-propeller type 3 domain-containing protein n=1 Tax=Microthlaspi erraticum TaxID=1685480 RepID=A0A6D2HGJ5_9BRAS|nr:unnamed protein product [Microthlaspi erraticum]